MTRARASSHDIVNEGGGRASAGHGMTMAVLLVIMICRMFATIFEEKLGVHLDPNRRRTTKRYIELLFRDGARPMRFLVFCMILGCGIVMAAELAWKGKEVAASQRHMDQAGHNDDLE